MAATRKAADPDAPRRPPAQTIEAREHQLVNLAVDLAEQQLRDGTASSQVMTHFLKLGTVREGLERERLVNENELLKARVLSLANQANVAETYEKAIEAMRVYQGGAPREADVA